MAQIFDPTYDWAFDQNIIQDALYGIGSKFADLENISDLENQYGIGSTGAASDARHQSYFSALSDTLAGGKIGTPNKLNQFIGDAGAFGAGLMVEIPGAYRALKGTAPWEDVWEDIKANWEGTFGTPYGTTSEDIYKNVYKRMHDQRATDQGIAQAAMKKQIQEAESKQKATSTYTGPVTHSFDPKQDTGRRPDKPGGFTDPGKGSYGPWKAQGGLIDLYRYGGFI